MGNCTSIEEEPKSFEDLIKQLNEQQKFLDKYVEIVSIPPLNNSLKNKINKDWSDFLEESKQVFEDY